MLRESLAPEPLERPSVHELRHSIADARERAHVAAHPQVPSDNELWTMPFAPAPTPATARTTAVPLEPEAPVESPEPAPSVGPPAGLLGAVPVREAAPLQEPVAPTSRIIPAIEERPAHHDQPFARLLPLGEQLARSRCCSCSDWVP